MLSQQQQKSELVIRYLPHSKQVPFHNDRYTYFYRLISGGTGSGKTKAGVFEMLSYLIDDNPGAVGYIFEPTYRMVRRILIPTLENLLGYPINANPLVRNYLRTENRIDFTNGSRLWFGGLEDPEMAEGPNIDVVMVDEARLVRHFDVAWRVVQRRIRGSVPGKYPTFAYITTTPDAPGSTLHSFFEHPETRDPRSNLYRMSLDDNKDNLPEEYIEGIKRSHHGGLAERFIHGRFAAIGAGTFKEFDYTIHVDQYMKHKPSVFKDVTYGVDFGFTNPTAILAVGFDGDDRAYVMDELYAPRLSRNQIVEEAKELREQYGNGHFYCDRSNPETIEFFNIQGIKASGSKAKRDETIRELAGRFLDAGDGRPRIYISPLCVNLIAELQVYDERKKEFDHAIDALRYALRGRNAPKGFFGKRRNVARSNRGGRRRI